VREHAPVSDVPRWLRWLVLALLALGLVGVAASRGEDIDQGASSVSASPISPSAGSGSTAR